MFDYWKMMIHKHYKLSIDAWWPFIVLKTIPEQFNNVHWLFTNVCFWGGLGCRVFIYKQKWWSKLCLFNVSDMWIQYLWMFSGINKHSKGIYFLGGLTVHANDIQQSFVEWMLTIHEVLWENSQQTFNEHLTSRRKNF